METGANLGFAKGNNAGIALATGRYLFLVNSDVKISARMRGNFGQVDGDQPERGAGGSANATGGRVCRPLHYEIPNPVEQPVSRACFGFRFSALQAPRWIPHGGFRSRQSGDVEILNGWFWVVRREALQQVGALDDRFFMYGEDMDWCYRFSKAGWRNFFCAESAAVHYGGASSALAPARFYVEKQRANLQYWKKHHGRVAAFAYLCTVLLNELLRTAGYTVAYLSRKSIREKAAAKVRRSVLCIACLAKLRTV